MDHRAEKKHENYFGACNSYYGFISYFDKIFNRESFDRIYVIKGGPGTGKSSFMKKILLEFKGKCNTQSFFCSSDPKSLDGVILENNGKSIAFIDGTAPHETDAKIPGAVDQIINLGDFWDNKWLLPQKEKIIELNKEKRNSYKCAYNYLRIAKECHNSENALLKEEYPSSESKRFAMKIASELKPNGVQKIDIRVISSFGKSGCHRLNTLDLLGNKRINLKISDFFYPYLMIDIKNAFDISGISYTAFPSAPDSNLYDALYIQDHNIIIGKLKNGETIDLSYLDDELALLTRERLRVAQEIKRTVLDESIRHFSIASEMHFSLEEIYSSAMNFKKVDEILNTTKENIHSIIFQ